jgi:hypothetical protein
MSSATRKGAPAHSDPLREGKQPDKGKSMKIHGVLIAILYAVAALAASSRTAIASEVLYDNSGFVEGQQSFSQSFQLDGPGTLTVTLSNIDWPESLASLNMVLSMPEDGLLGPEMGAGTYSFKMAGPGMVYAQWFGTAQGPLDAGVYGMKVSWQAVSVPLPTSIALLMSALALLAWYRRERRGSQSASPAAG